MKNQVLTSIFLLLSCALTAQIGFNAGYNSSWFGNGDKDFAGANHMKHGIAAGVSWEMGFYKSKFFFQPQISYISLGAKNPQEFTQSGSNKIFNTHHIQASVLAGINLKQFSIMAGPYLNRMYYANNSHFTGERWGWWVEKWDYYKKFTAGGLFVLQYDFIGIKARVAVLRGFTKVRNETYNDTKMMGNQDRAITIGLSVPTRLKTFKK